MFGYAQRVTRGTYPTKAPKNPELTKRLREAYEYAEAQGFVRSWHDANEKCGFENALFNKYIRGEKSGGTTAVIARIAEVLRVSAAWLALGEGSMLDEPGKRSITPVPPDAATGCRLGDREGYAEAEADAREEHPEWPTIVWREAREVAFRNPPELVTKQFVASVAKAIFDSMSDAGKAREWAADAKAAADLAESIREQLKARGLDPKRDPVEWNLEFLRIKSRSLRLAAYFTEQHPMRFLFQQHLHGNNVVKRLSLT